MNNYLKLLQYFRQFSLGIMYLGGLLFIDDLSGAYLFLTMGGLGFSAYCLLSAFRPIHEEPNWKLVYPELTSEYPDKLSQKKTT